MVSFDPAHKAVHYPPDRRFRIWIRPSILIGIGVAILSVIAASWIEVVLTGLPHVPAIPEIYPNNFAGPHGFPVWVRYCHFLMYFTISAFCRAIISHFEVETRGRFLEFEPMQVGEDFIGWQVAIVRSPDR
jgi:sulfoxide reductase catalytic subunit YedY